MGGTRAAHLHHFAGALSLKLAMRERTCAIRLPVTRLLPIWQDVDAGPQTADERSRITICVTTSVHGCRCCTIVLLKPVRGEHDKISVALDEAKPDVWGTIVGRHADYTGIEPHARSIFRNERQARIPRDHYVLDGVGEFGSDRVSLRRK